MALAGSGGPTKIIRRKMRLCYLRGMTDKQVALLIGVTEQTINNWKSSYPSMFESLKDWKRHADEEIELSLYERARGYVLKETKIVTHEGKITDEITFDKYYPPDTVACIYWLKNRQPKRWSDRKELTIDNPEGKKFHLAYKLDD